MRTLLIMMENTYPQRSAKFLFEVFISKNIVSMEMVLREIEDNSRNL